MSNRTIFTCRETNLNLWRLWGWMRRFLKLIDFFLIKKYNFIMTICLLNNFDYILGAFYFIGIFELFFFWILMYFAPVVGCPVFMCWISEVTILVLDWLSNATVYRLLQWNQSPISSWTPGFFRYFFSLAGLIWSPFVLNVSHFLSFWFCSDNAGFNT